MASGTDGRLKSNSTSIRKKGTANRLFLPMIKAMEDMVLNAEEHEYVRMLAWIVLIMWWSTLRWDDTQWMVQESMALSDRGFKAELRRTKTT